jgi:hypothetical protein
MFTIRDSDGGSTMNRHSGPGRYTLERFFAGELDQKSSAEVKAHLETCSECASYVKSLDLEKAVYLNKHPYRDWAASNVTIAESSFLERLKSWFFKPALFPLYGLALVLCVVVPVVIQNDDPGILYKGERGLSFVYQRDGVLHDGTAGKLFQQGDQIQLSYSFPDEHYAGLLSIDSKGMVSTYQPPSAGKNLTTYVKECDNCSVPQSIILDGTPGGELIILLIARKDLLLDDIRSWAAQVSNNDVNLSDVEKRVRQRLPRDVIECRTLLLQKR